MFSKLIPPRLRSRKLWMAFLGALLPVVAQYLTESVDLVECLRLSAGICVTYLLGQSWVDARTATIAKD
jgi:hypothetical protein